jgi:quinohemoprotein ethanol dehydrogenase
MPLAETKSKPRPAIGFLAVTLFLALISAACQQTKVASELPFNPADVSDSGSIHADREPENWMTYGRTYREQRFSPLHQIDDQNVSQLGLAWYYDLDTNRGQEATPIVVNGVMYFTSAWSKVFALNAATGKLLWSYDPKDPGNWAVNACCDVVNRGVAAWNNFLFPGTLPEDALAIRSYVIFRRNQDVLP